MSQARSRVPEPRARRAVFATLAVACFFDVSASHAELAFDTTSYELPESVNSSLHMVAGDLDGDGDLDLFAARDKSICILLNDGQERYEVMKPTAITRPMYVVALHDMDADGDLDVVAADFDGLTLLVNDGNVRFRQQAVPRQSAPDPTGWIVVADFDGDGDGDVLQPKIDIGASDPLALSGMVVSPNEGDGRFGDFVHSVGDWDMLGARDAQRLVLGDFDDDGDVDLVGIPGEHLALYRNDGNGGFTPSRLDGGNAPSLLDAGDLDGDGDLDLAVVQRCPVDADGRRQAPSCAILMNRGDGTFLERDPIKTGSSTRSVVVTDIDGDDRADLAFSFARREGGFRACAAWNDAEILEGLSGFCTRRRQEGVLVIEDLDSGGDTASEQEQSRERDESRS